MLYLDYELFERKYRDTEKAYNAILDEKEEHMATDHDRDDYLPKLKKINARVAEMSILLGERNKLVSMKKNELRNSKDAIDRVYYYRKIEKMKVKRISRIVHYSETQVYRLLDTIHENIIKAHYDDRK